ncbi:glycosyltransferase [Kitasatospora sp. NPDC059571]|uniref:glycosyltransferase n=1 Tax=Kitasatospora sp. NPDC059571 TaxID=3346871 RepID=UPI0036A6D6A0
MMIGVDRRTAAACPRSAARDSLYTPVRVVELDLDEPGVLRAPGGLGPVDPDGRVLALVRLHGHPLGLVTATGTAGDSATLRRALVDAAHRDLRVPALSTATPAARPGRVGRAGVPADLPRVSVVVATRDRPAMLRDCLDSLLRNRYPNYDVTVVDSAPSGEEARLLITGRYHGRVRYLREPRPGVARAHNRGLAAATGEILAIADDDTLVDAGWIDALVDGFEGDERIGCVTGLILPAELATRAQCALHDHGGFDKGFARRSWSLDHPPEDPLFPFTAGRFGSGANMAFRIAALRAIGGFDTATGTGTPALSGHDLLAFFRVIVNGRTLVYQPDAVVWHRHRRTEQALLGQAYSYGVGLGAYLAAALANEPGMLPALLRRLPRGAALALRRTRRRTPAGRPLPPQLARLEVKGLLYGPVGYLRGRFAGRTEPG